MILSMATAPYFFQMGKNLQEISNWMQQKAQAFFNVWTAEKYVAGGLITRKLDENNSNSNDYLYVHLKNI